MKKFALLIFTLLVILIFFVVLYTTHWSTNTKIEFLYIPVNLQDTSINSIKEATYEEARKWRENVVIVDFSVNFEGKEAIDINCGEIYISYYSNNESRFGNTGAEIEFRIDMQLKAIDRIKYHPVSEGKIPNTISIYKWDITVVEAIECMKKTSEFVDSFCDLIDPLISISVTERYWLVTYHKSKYELQNIRELGLNYADTILKEFRINPVTKNIH